MKREFNRIAVTDEMIEVLRSELNTNQAGTENVMRQIIEAGGLGMVRANGTRLSEAQIAAIEKGIPSDEDLRSVRMSCVHLVAGNSAAISPLMTDDVLIKRADQLAQYVLTGKKPGEA